MLKREIYLSKIRGFYNSDLIKILVGIRRSGKSVILKQIIEELKCDNVDNEHIIYINFEYIENEYLCDYIKLNDYIKNNVKDNKMYYIFMDEVQNVHEFERVVNSLRASLNNVSIFLTGSNSSMLSNELSTVLSGRYVSFTIYPLSYSEYIDLTKKEVGNPSFDNYLKWGGLPNVTEFNNNDNIRNYLQSVFDSIILRDVVERLKLTDTILFNQILEYLIDTTGREFSATNIINYLKSEGRVVSPKTLYAYIEALCNALIISKVYRYDIHGKAILKTLNKYFMTDFGIAQIRNSNFEINKTMLLENVVYNELLVRGYNVHIGKTKKGEVDFIAIKNNKVSYFQVSYLLNNEETLKREFNAFECIKDNYPKYVLSLDELDFSKDGIIHFNLINWLTK
ncbi:MAG: ATP-binding protein [bacterium]